MRALSQVDSQYIVAIDIETVRLYKNLEEAPADMQTAFAYKNKDQGINKSLSELEDLWYRQAALYAEFSKVCAVSLVFKGKDGNQVFCKSFYGHNEHQLLTDVAETLNSMKRSSNKYKLTGHSSKYFDYPFMGKRYIINRIPIPSIIDHSGLKPWEVSNLDNNELWKQGSTGPGSSLVALCSALGVPISKDEIQGSEVGDVYYDGGISGISNYCDLDTIATFNCLLAFKFEDIYQFNEVQVFKIDADREANPVQSVPPALAGKVPPGATPATAPQEDIPMPQGEPVEMFAEQPVLERIFTSREFSEEDMQEIIKRFVTDGKHVTKKDFEALRDTLSGLYISDTFGKADTKPVREHKTQVIEEFMNRLMSLYDASKKQK